MNSLASQKFYDENIDIFNILTSFNKGIEPFEVMFMYTKLLKYKNNNYTWKKSHRSQFSQLEEKQPWKYKKEHEKK